MKNKKQILNVIIILLLAAIVKAEVPAEDPFYSVGSDFLVIKSDTLEPNIHVLFDDTNIYLDNENDGTWDYKFTGDAGSTVITDPEGFAVADIGGLIHSDKPVGYLQQLTDRSTYEANLYSFVPPVSSLKSEYYTYGPYTDCIYGDGRYFGGWNVVAPQETTIFIDQNITGVPDVNFTIASGEVRSFTSEQFARVYSNNPFLAYNGFTIAATKSYEFFSPWVFNRLLIIEDNTEVKVDLNNDDAYDETYILDRGLHDRTFTYGAHIKSNKQIAVFNNYIWVGAGGHCGTNADFTFRNLYVGVNTFPTNIGSDMWGQGGSYRSIIGLYNEYSGLYHNTSYFVDKQSENDLIPNYTGTINSNTIKFTANIGKVHLWTDMPLLYYYKYSRGPHPPSQNYIPSYPYSQIYATSWPINKIIGTNELTGMNVRAFDPFATTTASGVEIKVKVPDSFIIPGGFSVSVSRKSLVDDSVIASTTTPESPSHVSDYYEFVLDGFDDSFIGVLSPLEYLDINYNVVSPGFFSNFDFPVEISYVAPTWQK